MANTAPPKTPPSDFNDRTLPLEVITAGETLLRIHQKTNDVIYFGSSGDYRFDSSDCRFGICYTGKSVESCFVETCLTNVGSSLVSEDFLRLRKISAIDIQENLNIVTIHGPGLARLGATSLVSGGSYRVSQAWSKAIHDHPQNVDGIAYRTSHDDNEFGVAIFERAGFKIANGNGIGLLDDKRMLSSLLDQYGVGLI